MSFLFKLGCRALRSTGLSDILINPTVLDNLPIEDWRDCIDIFDLEKERQVWPKNLDTFEKLVLLRRHVLPSTFNVDVFVNVTLDVVDAFVGSDHQVILLNIFFYKQNVLTNELNI